MILSPSQDVTTSHRRRSMIAPQHFAFVHAKAELEGPNTLWIWKYRYLTIFVALFFCTNGGYAVFFLPRSAWAFPIVNDRTLLRIHWAMGTPFLAGAIWQQLSVPMMATAGKRLGPIGAARFRQWHRWIGRCTIFCSLGAATTAFLLAPKALAGNWIFIAWSVSWMIMSVETLGTAVLKQYKAHKKWAEALYRTALAFLYGRVMLVGYNYLSRYWVKEEDYLRHAQNAYSYSMIGTGIFTILLTVQCAYAARHIEKQSVVQRRWRKIRSATAFLVAANKETNSDNGQGRSGVVE
ncbi:expressed unknown protein [Seminavis robusta]|uniref:Uncharacterized protein n=1 Tax=Seminavis robusta TaxID=568900 RepID=A0A9N8HPJ4_9STRA|nr:expressed unknown protein [Seminavis robusta]|eukprot:Sro1334_g263840.1 n/a (294) ;mRNA; r:23497-24378